MKDIENKILRYLKENNYISNWWNKKDFIIVNYDDEIVFKYVDVEGVGLDKIRYNKENNMMQVYNYNNYYNSNEIEHTILNVVL